MFSFEILLLILLQKVVLLVVFVHSNEVADIVACSSLQAKRLVNAISEKVRLRGSLLHLLLDVELAEDASVASVLFSHPLGGFLLIYHILLLCCLVIAVVTSEYQVVGPGKVRLGLTLIQAHCFWCNNCGLLLV